MRFANLISACLSAILLLSCVQTQEADEPRRSRLSMALDPDFNFESFEKPEDQVVADPFEPVNRKIYAFNNQLDRFLLEPVSKAYAGVLPNPARNSVRAFIDNLKSPVWFANDVLQGEWDRAGTTAGRFALNSTLGVVGFYDFAANHANMKKHDEDFGQTLGVWGVGNGPYIMLPVFGPSTARDALGRVGDRFIDPINYAEGGDANEFLIGLRLTDVVDIRVRTAPAINATRDSADPYAQVRSLYIQAREGVVRNGRNDFEELPDFE